MIERAARARPSRFWLMLGDASYSIYLAHPFAQRVLLIAVNRTVGLASDLARRSTCSAHSSSASPAA